MSRFTCLFAVTTVLLLGGQNLSRADSIELINGDLLHGKVVSFDDDGLRLISDIHGNVIIDRDKVAGISLGERKLARVVAAEAVNGVDAQGVVRRTVPAGDQATMTARVPVTAGATQQVARRLRAQGLSAQNIAELQKALPMLKEPAARQYFDEKVQGLTEGTIDVEDIRKEAIRAREEYKKSAKSLGPDGEKALNQALGGYLQILDRFIRDADPKAANETQPTANEKQPAATVESEKDSAQKQATPPPANVNDAQETADDTPEQPAKADSPR